ncbi:Vgb family protein [Allorhodopirellula solitaria]|uniref:Virginiamycin B lyase n=1 Tax=Allorhodopirellula solitaria TaxID=2527987 RepID=A0A5C5XPN1_9BACT|nr:hypothetical protein [Allorhodopirellula solitaria]TWT64834.1 Virginiamycin B lyase [Allorhodopirellula solitaria]
MLPSNLPFSVLPTRSIASACAFLACLSCLPAPLRAQDSEPDVESAAAPAYPIAVAVDGDNVYTVDLDLPGVWKSSITGDAERELFVAGSKLLRKPMNRPRCIAMHPDGGILVGDSATREVYHIAKDGGEPQGLSGGKIGIAMTLAVSADGETLYVGDAEKRATLKLPISGGAPELVARVNARGLAFDEDGNLWAVTPDDAAVVKIDVGTGDVDNVITGRPFQYPNGLVWAGDGNGYVTDGYGHAIWKFTAEGKTEKWHEGEPLVGPVGIAIADQSVWVADPKQKQIYQFDRESKQATPKL